MDAADFNKAADTVVELIKLMTQTQRQELAEQIEDAGICLHCWAENCSGWCTSTGTPRDG